MSVSHQRTIVEATADVTLRVPRGEAGDLEAGAAAVLDGIATLETVTIDRVTGVDPTWTDIRVDLDAEVSAEVAGDDPLETLETELEDGFGIVEVNGLAAVEQVDEPEV